MSRIEVMGMVYRGSTFAEFMWTQLRRRQAFRMVGNDPDIVCSDFLMNCDPDSWDVYNDPNSEDHYLSRVYRGWNYCVESSSAEYVCLVNSDMAFSPGWLEALERRLDGKTLPCSRLVEPGFIRPGRHAIEIDLGRDPRTFPFDSWKLMASDLADNRTEPGGLFMPCVLHRQAFLEVGGYPEGNVNGVSGDVILFNKMAAAGFKHVTCFDSLVYHMQEGEMRHHE